MNLAHKTLSEISHNARLEVYPEYKRMTVCSRPVFREKGWEAREKPASIPKPQNKLNAPQDRSVSRATKSVYDIAALNDFEYFFTLTLNAEKISRVDTREISERAKTFFHNGSYRKGWKYIAVPEFHSDQKSIHIHGLICGELELVDSNHKTTDGKPIYNMPEWRYGFSTCIPLTGNRSNVAAYISKYITKDARKIFGNFYYAGGDIRREPPRELLDVDFDLIDTEPYEIPDIGLQLKFLRFEEV